jgi:hypothetical protein
MPSGGYRPKKPLTKAQVRKLQQAYEQAGVITESVKKLESEEQAEVTKSIEEDLNALY